MTILISPRHQRIVAANKGTTMPSIKKHYSHVKCNTSGYTIRQNAIVVVSRALNRGKFIVTGFRQSGGRVYAHCQHEHHR